MKQYEAVYRNTGLTPRKMSSPSDAYAIERGRSEWQDAKDFFIGALIVAVFIALFIGLGYGFMSWLAIGK